MKIRIRTGLAVLACAAVATVAHAADDAARSLAAGCLGCHQSTANQSPTIPSLYGQPRASIAAKLRAFRDGAQAGTIMPQLAKGYDDAQIDAIAGYFAVQKGPQ